MELNADQWRVGPRIDGHMDEKGRFVPGPPPGGWPKVKANVTVTNVDTGDKVVTLRIT